jgi:rSAM/selenodomain-associated transferase 1
MNNVSLVIMAKEPRIGRTKTRLCPPLTHTQASTLYEALLLDTIKLGSNLKDIDLGLAVTPSGSSVYFEPITLPTTLLIPIDCIDIGQCLLRALTHLLDMGYQKVIALNSDGPTLPADYIYESIRRLDEHDIVIGPAEDGGYYLIGLNAIHPEIFRDIEWSTNLVLTQTLKKAEELNLGVSLLPEWYDVDNEASFNRLIGELMELPAGSLPNTRRFLKDFPSRNQSE